jgi:propanol-preferring alcohol dehydrogenase
VIERLGAGNPHGLVEGMRVALPWLGYACGDCAYCNTGWRRSASPRRTWATR